MNEIVVITYHSVASKPRTSLNITLVAIPQ